MISTINVPLRIKWSDFDRTIHPAFPAKVREELIRDQILDWLAFQKGAFAWWLEPHGALKRKAGKLVFHVPNNRHYMTGAPDIIGSWNGRPLGIEVKRPASKGVQAGVASEGQIHFMHMARSQGWVCFFAWRLEDVKLCLGEFDQMGAGK